MNQANSRLDRIEAAIEESERRFDERIDREMQLLADLRTRQEIQSNQIEAQSLQISELRSTAAALLQIVQIHQQGIETMATEFRQHRSDGHGA